MRQLALSLYFSVRHVETTESEVEAVTKGLWLLAFKATEQLIAEPGCLDELKRLAHSHDAKQSRSRENARNALWLIKSGAQGVADEGALQQAPVTTIQQGLAEPPSAGDASAKLATALASGHVMISYQWATKPTLLRVRDRLKDAGLTTWMDVDNMSGSLLDSMAEAVEKASVVIMCLTEKYKESASCRMECEYAHQCGKPLIPLMLQQGYRADGWLGLIKGSKLHFDFSREEKFEPSLEGLLREIHKLGGSPVA